MKKGDVNSGS